MTTKPDYNAMMTSALKEECRKRGLPVSARMVSPKTGKEHCNWLPREALIASLERSDAGLIEVPADSEEAAAASTPVAIDDKSLEAKVELPAVAEAATATKPAKTAIMSADAPDLPDFLKEFWGKLMDEKLKAMGISASAKDDAPAEPKPAETKTKKTTCRKKATPDEKNAVMKLAKLMSEFQFVPQLRFVTSVANAADVGEAKAYMVNYFRLTNNPYANDLAEKLKSAEGAGVAEGMAKADFGRTNRRLEVFFGAPGSGKTTKAMELYPEAEVVVCHAGTTPDELFRGFTFEDGKPVFKGCALGRAMQEGKPVILDEINLLSHECLRALQAVTDGKDKATIGTDTFPIKDGFKVIATMNLTVDGQTEGLPTPLVDRAAVIKEFEMPIDELCDIAKNLPR